MKLYTHQKHQFANKVLHEICSNMFTKNTVVIQYNVGSIHDPQGKLGLAHLVEHLVFNAHTTDIGRSYLEKRGVSISATTYKEKTLYTASSYFLSPKELLQELLHIMNMKPTEEDLVKEKAVISSEILERHNQEYDLIYDEVLRQYTKLYPNFNAYKHSIVGTTLSIDNISISDVLQHIETQYKEPCIVVATNTPLESLVAQQMLDMISNTLNSIKKHVETEVYRLFQVDKKISDIFFIATCVSGGDFIERSLFVSLLRDYVANNWSSVGNYELRTKKGVTYFVSGFTQSLSPFTMSYVYCNASNEHYEEIKEVFSRVYSDIANGHIQNDTYEASKKMLITYLYDLSRNEYDTIEMFLWLNNNGQNEEIITLDDYIARLDTITCSEFKLFFKHLLKK